MHWGIAAFIIHIPLFHLWLHALLPIWRKFPLAFYAFSFSIIGSAFWVFPKIEQLSPQLFNPSDTVKTFGIALMLLGLVLALWTLATLGPRCFFAYEVLRPRPGTKLTKAGPFKYWPHPAYSGYLLAALGNLLSSGQFYLLVIFGWLMFFTPIIIYLEEHELKRRLKT